MKKNKSVLYLTQAAMIAAVYVVLVEVFKPISFSAVQVRIAEALTVLPFFTPAAIPGVTLGCLISNLLGSCDILDIIFGTLATFMGAVVSYKLRKNKWLVPIPPIVFNTVIIPWVLKFAYAEATPVPLLMLSIGVGEVLSCGILGMILLFALNKYKGTIFKNSYANF